MAEAAVAAVLWAPRELTRKPTRRIAKPTQTDFDRAVLLPDKPLKQLLRLHKLREFLLLGFYFALSLILFDLEADWNFAHDTYDVYTKTVEKGLKYEPFIERKLVSKNVDFLQPQLTNITNTLGIFCRDCKVGVTSIAQSLDSFTLADFVCSDFDSIAGTTDYPPRDCMAANADYAMSPSANKAPCCKLPQLVQASMAIMAWSILQPQFLEPDFLSRELQFSVVQFCCATARLLRT